MMTRLQFVPFAVLAFLAARCLPANASPNRALPSRITLASRAEPGQRLVITGRTFGVDGKPRGGVWVQVWHTDIHGRYRSDDVPVDFPSSPPRLSGALVSAADGSYQIDTVKPGGYPGGVAPAHVHFRLRASGLPEQYAILQFEGDPALTPAMIAKAAGRGTFAPIRPLARDANGVLHCKLDLQLSAHPRGDA